MTASKLDFLIDAFDNENYNPQSYDILVKEKIDKLYKLLDRIKPIGDDDLKIIYFSVNRGDIDHYGDYDELYKYGDVSSYEEFEKKFNEDYPDDIYWYRLVTSKYKSYKTISINYKCIIYTDMEMDNGGFINNSLYELLDFIIYKVNECIDMLNDNTYNDYIDKNLSYKNRFGVIKRSDYWKLYPDTKEKLFDLFSQEDIDYFIKNASNDIDDRIENMTSGKYFECVRLSYKVNDYDIGNLSDRDLYLKYADGRDEGLSEIDMNSSIEFDNWYNDKNRFGGHPYEIICGHSFSRVNLYIMCDDKGYYISLDGNVILRKIEIVKIYLILRKNNIPVKIYNVDKIKNAFCGDDYIGIVPDDIIPIRCGSYFNDYNPMEFIHYDDKIFDYVIWQDIEKLYLM